MKTAIKIYLFLIALTQTGTSQNEFSKWYFGQQAGLDFSTSPPTALINGVINTGEGVATICDNAGNLLFYTDGAVVFNSTHAVMANGLGLFGSTTSSQSGVIVKQPGNANIYYIFTTAAVGGSQGANYSVVDMSLAAGLGSVTVLNTQLYSPTCEKQVGVRHCNGKDIWIVSHHYGTNEFRSYLLTSTGVSTSAVVSAIGETIAGAGLATAGHLKISPDGKKLAMATASNSIPTNLGDGGFQLFDFDAATGIVSNSLALLSTTNIPSNGRAYGVEFSPDGGKLYGTTSILSTTATVGLYQWNICATGTAAIIASQYSISLGSILLGSVQRAVDGKLYIATASTQSLSVINNPNASGAAMNFTQNALSIAPKLGRLGLPNYINTYTKPVPALFSNSLACQTSSFAVPPVPTFSSGCSSTPYSPSSYLWDFGEPSSGAANTSTLANPAHTYAGTGTYSVTLILYSTCTNDTIRKTISITTPGPTVNVAGNFAICKGDKQTYTVSGANSYLWSNSTTNPTISLSPATTTVYSVSGTLNSCTLSKTFTVTVNPCLGINTLENNEAFSIFPNPFTDVLLVETKVSSRLMIFDMSGKLIQENKLNSGKNEISTSELKAGIYLIQANSVEGVWRGRFVKVE